MLSLNWEIDLAAKIRRSQEQWESLRPKVEKWARDGKSISQMMSWFGLRGGKSFYKIKALIPEELKFKYKRGGHNKITESYESATKIASKMKCRRTDTKASGLQKRIKLLFMSEVEYICSICGTFDWNGQSISLHLDHIDGDWKNYAKENLRLLCPNCHSQQPTTSRKRKIEPKA